MPFELQPELTGELLSLRPLRNEDFEALFAVAADPLIWEQHPASDRYQEVVFREFFREAMAGGGAFVVIDNADGRIIGSSRYHDYSEEKRQVEVGWTFLARQYWGGRYNRELKNLMLDHAFRFVDRVLFLVGTGNIRSQRAVEKLGGVRIGTTTRGTGQKSVVYEVTTPIDLGC